MQDSTFVAVMLKPVDLTIETGTGGGQAVALQCKIGDLLHFAALQNLVALPHSETFAFGHVIKYAN